MNARKKIYLIISLLFAVSLCCSGQAGNQIIDYKTKVILKKGKLSVEESYLIQINNKESDWIADIQIPFKEGNEVDLIEAVIIDSKGEIVRKLKKKEVTTKSDISYGTFFEDDFVKTFNLRWNKYPYRIRYSYKEEFDQFFSVSSWRPLVYKDVPVKQASLQVELPHAYKVAIAFSDLITYELDTLEDTYVHRWSINDPPLQRSEMFSPPIQESMPKVSIVAKEFYYGVNGSFKSWASFGVWVSQLNDGLDVLPLYEKHKVDQLVKGVTNKRELVKKLYHYLQDNTRYINVAIDIGGLKPYAASYVAKNKYGDCKALTIYMKALLNAYDIPSFYTLINAKYNPERIKKEFPSQQFNHVILAVPLKEDTIWLENTANHLPYNYLGTFTQDRYGLLVAGENSRLVKTPALKPSDVLEKRSYTFSLNEDGSGKLQVANDVQGKAFEKYKYIQSELKPEDQKLQIEKDLRITNSDIRSWEFEHPDRDASRLKLKVALDLKGHFTKLGNFMVLKPFGLELFNLEAFNRRKNSIRIHYPYNKHDSLVYQLPFLDRYEVEIPKNIAIESKYGNYFQTYKLEKRQIIITRIFRLFKADYPLEDYESFYSFISLIKRSQHEASIVLNPKES